MSIEKRSGKWGYRFKVNRVEYRGSTGLPATKENRSEAEKIAAREQLKVIAKVEERQKLSADPHFADASTEFLDWCFTTEYRSKFETARRIRTSFASLRAFFNCRVSEITPRVIELYKTHRLEHNRVTQITLRHDLHALSVFFRKYAVKAGWALSNPTMEVTKPSGVAHRIHVVTPEEEKAYFDVAAKSRNLYDVTRLMLLQGCRPEEIMSLQQKHIDLKVGTMQIAGGKSEAARRLLDLTAESVEIFTRRLETPNKWVFPSPRRPGEHITQLKGPHDTACRDAEVAFVMYDFRHTFATRMLTEHGVDPVTLKDLMGHSTVVTVLNNYVHPSKEGKRLAMKKYSDAQGPRLKIVKGGK